jgi:hypothetical protein
VTSIEKNHDCADVDEFVQLLRGWLDKTDEKTVGDTDAYKGKPWLRLHIGDVGCHLNADTRREGVEKLLAVVGREGPRFSVIANNGGVKVNRVVAGEAKEPIKYLYFYTGKPQPAPADLWASRTCQCRHSKFFKGRALRRAPGRRLGRPRRAAFTHSYRRRDADAEHQACLEHGLTGHIPGALDVLHRSRLSRAER